MPNELFAFTKYVGCGNDFVIFDNRTTKFPSHNSLLIQKLCHRQFGIGADGLLLLEPSNRANARMRIFNADGSEAEMCGNGIRCFVAWLKTLFGQSSYTIETGSGIVTASSLNSDVFVEMGSPQKVEWNKEIEFLDQIRVGHYLNTGVPHLVIFVENCDSVDVDNWGAAIRHHPVWWPEGVNVNFVQVISRQKLKIRTFERGVEKETLACGTGATAAALAFAYLKQVQAPIIVETQSKENLKINFQLNEEIFSKVEMIGPAYCVYEGKLNIAAFV